MFKAVALAAVALRPNREDGKRSHETVPSSGAKSTAADGVAAMNIKEAGLALLAMKAFGGFLVLQEGEEVNCLNRLRSVI